ncbi:hypothetical protein OY671_011774, partial [Metschnikowia pulcherrima]
RSDGRIRIAATSSDDPARIEVLVQDNGSGIDPSASERSFEPLFTSRANGLGSGSAVCANIAQAHAGRIWLERSKPGDTEFRGARIAIVDDQAEVRRALGESLGVYGYVTELFETADALSEATVDEKFACIVSDVRMPGMDGVELV